MDQKQIKRLFYAFDGIHDCLRDLGAEINCLNDPQARGLLDAVERGVMKPLRRLRVYLGVPYNIDGRPVGSKNDRTA